MTIAVEIAREERLEGFSPTLARCRCDDRQHYPVPSARLTEIDQDHTLAVSPLRALMIFGKPTASALAYVGLPVRKRLPLKKKRLTDFGTAPLADTKSRGTSTSKLLVFSVGVLSRSSRTNKR